MPTAGRRRGSRSASRYLASRTRLGVKFGLDTIRAVVARIASAIVSVDLDHEAYLGTSRAAIAREKAGVLRRERTTVLGSLDAESRDAVAAAARAVGAGLVDARAGCAIRQGEGGLDLR